MATPNLADLAGEYQFDGVEEMQSPAPANPQPTASRGKVATSPPPPAANGSPGLRPPVAAEQVSPTNGMSREYPQLAAVMVSDARRWGVSEDVLQDGDPENVREAIADARAEARQAARDRAGQNGQQAAPQRQLPPRDSNGQFLKPNGQVDIEAIKTAESGGLENIAFKLDWGKRADGTEVLEQDYDEPLVRILKHMGNENATLKATVAAMQAKIDGLHQAEQGRQQASGRQWLDQVFAGMAPEVKAFIGQGAVNQITKEQHARRMAIIKFADTMPGTNLGEKLVQAASTLFGGGASPPAAGGHQQQGPAAGRRAPTAEEWNSGGLAHPTQRNGEPDMPGTDRAVMNLHTNMRAMGLDPELVDANETSLDGFPD